MQYPHLRFRITLEACNKAIGLRILGVGFSTDGRSNAVRNKPQGQGQTH